MPCCSLRDGSVVELRERSGFSTSGTASDLTVRLSRGSIIVQAAKRRQGHLYVATADCRVAVTGTVFSVVSGVKGSRVSVVEGEVHVAQDNQDNVLHPGDQTVTSASMEPHSVRDDVGWSRNRDRLLQQLDKLRTQLQQIHLPALRYSSRLLDRLPASTAVFASIPNLGQYLAETQGVFSQNLEQSPELREWWSSKAAGIEPVIEKLRAASEYLGDEIVITGLAADNNRIEGPVFLAETKREGFPEFLKKTIPAVIVETRPGLVVFGPNAVRRANARRRARFAQPRIQRHAVLYADRCCLPGRRGHAPVRRLLAHAKRRLRRRVSATSSPSRRKSATRWRCAPRSASTASAPASRAGWPIPPPWGRSITSRRMQRSSPHS